MEDDDDELPQLIPLTTNNISPLSTKKKPTHPVSPIVSVKSIIPKEKFPPVPLTILTGWLGAGKTSLLTYLLDILGSQGKQIAIVQNEVSAVGVEDGLVLQDDSGAFGEIIELANGCVCCSVKTDFIQALEVLIKKKRFDYVFLECSGLANPGEIIRTLWVDEELESSVYLDSVVTVVDAKNLHGHLHDFRSESKQVIHQIAYADRIILNKKDLVPHHEILQLIQTLNHLNAGADVLLTTYSRVDIKQIMDIKALDDDAERVRGIKIGTKNEHNHCHESHNHANSSCSDLHDHTITTYILESDKAVSLVKIKTWLADLLWKYETADDIQNNDNEVASYPPSSSLSLLQSLISSLSQPSTTSLYPFTNINKEMEIFRMKGILSINGENEPYFLQGVQQLFDIQPSMSRWDVGKKKTTRIVVIGRFLNIEILQKGFFSCVQSS